MSNYNSQLQSNNTDLQAILNSINELPEVGGVELPELANEGIAADLLENKELIGSDGNKIIGSMPNNGSINSTMDGINTKTISIPAGYTSGGAVRLDGMIDTEVNTQAELIAQIQAAVDGLPDAEGGNSSAMLITGTISLAPDADFSDMSRGYYYTDLNGLQWGYLKDRNPHTFSCIKDTIVYCEDPIEKSLSIGINKDDLGFGINTGSNYNCVVVGENGFDIKVTG